MSQKENDNLTIIAEVASMYYEKNIPQNEIAEKMYYSKSKVSRLLRRAKELGIVEIQIKYPIERAYEIEREVKELFGLRDAIIIRDFPDRNEINTRLKRLGKIAADYLEEILKDGDLIGLSWGRTLNHMVTQMKPKESKEITVVQMMGASADGYDDASNSINLVRHMSEAYNGSAMFLYAPLFVENNLVKNSLMKEKIIAKTINFGKKVDYLVTGIADFNVGDTAISWAGYLNEKRKKELQRRGAVGFFCGHFIDSKGNPVLGEEEDNIIGVSLHDIKQIPFVIAVSGGVNKAKATYAALNGKYIDCLITDITMAKELIQLKTQKSKL